MTEDELRGAIHAAFPTGERLEFGNVIEHSCEECWEVARTFRKRKWRDIPAESIDTHYHSLPLLSPRAFRQFLPAFMLRGLESQDQPWGPNDVLEFTTYSLLPENVDSWWLERVSGLTSSQVLVIVEFLRHARARGEGWFGEDSPKADEYWSARSCEAAEQAAAPHEARKESAFRDDRHH